MKNRVSYKIKKRVSYKIKKRVSFDFDGTLSDAKVQRFAETIINKFPSVEVWCVTARYDEAHKHIWEINPSNEDLFAVTDRLGINRSHIAFMNMERPKAEWFRHTNFLWHLDDDPKEIKAFPNRIYYGKAYLYTPDAGDELFDTLISAIYFSKS